MLKIQSKKINLQAHQPRRGCKDIWNAYMAEGATYTLHDIPYCPTTASDIPHDIITWEEAKAIYKKKITVSETNFTYDAFVCFYMDDYKFDGVRGVWHEAGRTLEILRHFTGVITPDFSTYQDFPEPIKIYATYRMRLIGFWWGRNSLGVVNNVRWGTKETFWYCFDGIPVNSMVAIGTVGGGPRKCADRQRFEEGLDQMVKTLHPHTIIVYGAANYECFEKLKTQGINIVAFPSKTAKVFAERR